MNRFPSYRQAAATGAGRVGAKGWTLAQLAEWGFPVPDGFVVDREVYQDAIAEPSVMTLVNLASRISLSDLGYSKTEQILDDLRTAILATGLCERDRKGLDIALNKNGLAGQAVAVRSSATGEDGADHTFAGIHESVLNAQGISEITNAILTCFASLWTVQAVAYRRRMGIADADVNAAVLICAMIHADGTTEPKASGVVFTADPNDGRRDTFVVESVPGLGDKLVSGRVNPETLHARLSPLSFACPESQILPISVLQDLLVQCNRVQWALGDSDRPQDIEWAWDGKKVYILQARPITALARRTFDQITDQPAIWTNANFKEVLSGILSPMGWSLMPATAAETFFQVHHIAGYKEPKGMQLVRRIDGRAYVDAAIIQYSAFEAFGILPGETNRTFGGFQPEISLPGPAKRTARQAGALMKVMRALLIARKRLPKQLAELETRVLKKSREDLGTLSPCDLFARSQELTEPEWQPPFMLASAIGSTWLGMARQLAVKRKFNVDFEAMISGLMAARGGVVSADHAYDLQKIGSSFEPGSAEHMEALQDWMQAYGHRGFNEFDIASARWREQPEKIAQMARDLAMSSHNPSSAQKARKVAEKMLAELPFYSRLLVRFLASRAAEGFRIREQGKSCLIATVGLSRIIVLEWGRRLADQDLIENPDDVFYLTFSDFWAWAKGLWDGAGARALVEAHKAETARWTTLPEPADVILDRQGSMDNAPPPLVQNHDGCYAGSGVSPGRAEGTACKLTRPDELDALGSGGILVARSTDPSWTPLFLRADGIVVEIGGYLSHGAIVAREFGLPAVVNIPGVFDQVNTGYRLMIDGGQGTVQVGIPANISLKC